VLKSRGESGRMFGHKMTDVENVMTGQQVNHEDG